MKKRFYVLLVLSVLFQTFLLPVKADIGPKPAVYLTIGEGFRPDDLIMILSEDNTSYGPNRPLHETGGDSIIFPSEEVKEYLMNYKDNDGYVVWNYITQIGQNDKVNFTYYCPKNIKVGVYRQDSKQLIVSQKIERSHLEDYYRAVCLDNAVILTDNFDLFTPIWHAGVRMIATIVIELAIALLFGFRKKEQIRRILAANVFTQLIVNGFIVLSNRMGGILQTLILLFPLELIIFLIEGILYHSKLSEKKGKNWLYALLANIVSAAIGIYTSWL